ncbi:MAG: hypothetical protein HGB08_00280 [Candidatus Moranbacteria bacterium]|nr:hypothetical protein [Candidatus Moranbacteria bacterium]
MKNKNGMRFLGLAVSLPMGLLSAFDAAKAYGETYGGWSIDDMTGYGLPDSTITQIIIGILSWLLAIFGVLGVVGFLVSGVMYLISFGDDDMMKRAKNGMMYSIYGIIVGLAGLVVIRAAYTLLNGGAFF